MTDERWMRRALELAARGMGETNPNPMVGCVVVKGGRVIGEGHHRRAGGPHAEVYALQEAGTAARGATLYLNLEPCSILGRTPPCAPLVASSGVTRLVVAMKDPNPAVNGRGLTHVRRAGVQVDVGVLEDEAAALNERFAMAVRRKRRPFVMLKAALTLDGRIATATGQSKWITTPAQRRQARGLRRLHDGVAVGIGTVLRDDPLLLPSPRVRRPFSRVVFDSELRLPLGSRLVRTAETQTVIVLCREAATRKRRLLEERGVILMEQPGSGPRVGLAQALAALRYHGLWSLMVEGGSELLGSFLTAGLFDQVALFRAGLLLGGRDSRPAFGGSNPASLRQARRLSPAGPLAYRALLPSADPLFELWYPEQRLRHSGR